MSPRPPPPLPPLPALLRRLEKAIEEGRQQHEQWKQTWKHGEAPWRGPGPKGAEEWERWVHSRAEQMEHWAQKHARGMEDWARRVGDQAERVERKRRAKWERQMRREQAREQKRALRRQHQLDEANPLVGWVFAAVAVLLAAMAVLTSDKWWLIFVALGMGSKAASILGRVHERSRLEVGQGTRPAESLPAEAREAPAPERSPVAAPVPAPEADPRTGRVDVLCDKLLNEFRAGPGLLRDVVHQPEQTVEGLRKSCHELARRERELRSLTSPEDERRLEEDRTRLATRVASESDAVVKERLEGTLRLLDEQRRQRADLATSASRLEAEHLRLFYTLENLYTQVLRVRSADAANVDVAGAGLRRSVEQLGQEMDAVAEALEEVHGEPASRSRVRS